MVRRFPLLTALVLFLLLEGYATPAPGNNLFVHQLKSTAYSYNTQKDSLFISFQFDFPPLLRPHYSLKTDPGIMIEFHNTNLHANFIQNDTPEPILDIGFNEYKIGQEIFITKVSIFLEFAVEYNVTREGNLLIIGIKLPDTFVKAQSRNKQIEKLKPNKLMSYSHTSTASEMQVKLNFKRIPKGRIHYRLENPSRVVYDFYNTGNRAKLSKSINASPVKKIKIQNFDILDIKVTRLIVFTYEVPPFEEITDGNTLVLRFKSEGWKLSKQEPLGTFQHKWVSIMMSTLTLSYSVVRIFFIGGG